MKMSAPVTVKDVAEIPFISFDMLTDCDDTDEAFVANIPVISVTAALRDMPAGAERIALGDEMVIVFVTDESVPRSNFILLTIAPP